MSADSSCRSSCRGYGPLGNRVAETSSPPTRSRRRSLFVLAKSHLAKKLPTPQETQTGSTPMPESRNQCKQEPIFFISVLSVYILSLFFIFVAISHGNFSCKTWIWVDLVRHYVDWMVKFMHNIAGEVLKQELAAVKELAEKVQNVSCIEREFGDHRRAHGEENAEFKLQIASLQSKIDGLHSTSVKNKKLRMLLLLVGCILHSNIFKDSIILENMRLAACLLDKHSKQKQSNSPQRRRDDYLSVGESEAEIENKRDRLNKKTCLSFDDATPTLAKHYVFYNTKVFTICRKPSTQFTENMLYELMSMGDNKSSSTQLKTRGS